MPEDLWEEVLVELTCKATGIGSKTFFGNVFLII